MMECFLVSDLRLRLTSCLRKLQQRSLCAGVFLAAAGAAAIACPGAYAQTAHFSGTQVTLPTSMLSNPKSIAVDANGNVYIADLSNNRVLKETLSNGSYTESTVGVGLNAPEAVAVDASGNVYIADSGSGRLLKETVSGQDYTERTISTTVGYAFALAVDSTGNVFAAVPGSSQVFEEQISGSAYNEITIGTNLVFPTSVAVDASGNVYIADAGVNPFGGPGLPAYQTAGVVYKETPSATGFTQSTLFSGLSNLFGIAVGGNGNIYLSVYGTPDDSEATQIILETPSGAGYVKSLFGSSTYDFVTTVEIAVDTTGAVYLTNINNVDKVTVAAGDAGPVSVAGAGSTVSLIFTFDSAGMIGAPKVTTEGAVGKDFFDAGSGLCNRFGPTFPYTAGVSCTVDVTLIPLLTGPRHGAVQLVSSAGDVIATGYVHGIGVAPQVNFLPETQSSLTLAGVVSESAVAADSAGNLYIAEAAGTGSPQNAVVKETLTGTGYVQSTVAMGLVNPVGVAVDGAGNVFIADQGAGQVVEEMPQSSGGYASGVAFSNLGAVESVAVDGAGNVYIGSPTGGLLKETLSNGLYAQSTLAAGVNPSGIAVDNQGNIFLSDGGNNQIVEETPSSDGYMQNVVVSGLNNPQGIAVDANGNVYVADTANSRVVQESLVQGVYAQSVLADGLMGVVGVSVDGSGNVFAASPTASNVWKLDFSDAPSLTFAATALGTTSNAQTVTVKNVGNAPLTFPIPSTGSNPSISAGFSLGSTGSAACPLISMSASTPGTIAAGASCQLPISFDPTEGGPISGALVLTDTNLNTTNPPGYAVQSISLSGTGLNQPTLSFAAITSKTYGDAPFTVSATSASSGAVTYAVVSGPATISGATVTLTGAGTVALSASQAADSSYGPAAATTSFTVAAETFTISAASGSTATTTAGGSATYSLTVTPGANMSLPGGVSLNVTGLPSGATATFSPAVLPAGAAAAVNLTVQTSSAQTANVRRVSTGSSMAVLALGLFLLPLLGVKLPRTRLRGLLLFLAAAMLGSIVGVTGCSGGGKTSTPPPAAQSYPLTVAATDAVTGAKSSVSLTLTVQ